MSKLQWYNIPPNNLTENKLINYILEEDIKHKYLYYKQLCVTFDIYLPTELWTIILYYLCYDEVNISPINIIDWFKTYIMNKTQLNINKLYTTTLYDRSYILGDYDVAYSLISNTLISNSTIISKNYDLFFGFVANDAITSVNVYINEQLFYTVNKSDLYEFTLDNIISIDNLVLINPAHYTLQDINNIVNMNMNNFGRYIIQQEYYRNYKSYTFCTIPDILPILLCKIPYWEVSIEFITNNNILSDITLLYGKLSYELLEDLKTRDIITTDKLIYKYYSVKKK